VRYAENGRIYVPVENLGMLDRYIGSDDRAPALDRLGSRSWHLARTRTAAAVNDYAEELLAIYARRQTAGGFAFSHDTPEQQELEATFSHEETPDQLRAIGEVKRDMESSRPMDRLVCGDVAYGKTEVALRAAFKAVMDGKQVAVLVPTTILAMQHFETFRFRAKPFPIRIAMLSRFVTPGERARVVADLAVGRVDIVIGTHVLLGRAVKFRDLGLLIVDEEQRFGVRQKELIKKRRGGVDALALSATPIPRTLYMALVGLRDISAIHTPPPGRREILTDVQPWNDELIRRYVLREVNRGGQVFFIHNRIESLPAVHERLVRLCPELRIVMAHGRQPERRLARTYFDFAAGGCDVLCSTAIVESGLDLPRVNTIIVNRADWFGLADLHQLRGRVGRTQEQGYALFMIPDRLEIAEEARKRLSAIMAYSQLGSGFKLAMRDMEIRGVGNLLGVEQHGHVARVGFNLYVRLLKEAIAQLKGEAVAPEPELSLDVEAYIPAGYVADSYERVAVYKRLLSVETEAELSDLQAELVDRFGRYPPIIENLFRVARVRVLARRRGLLRVSLKANRIVLVGARSEQVVEGGLERLVELLSR
jgi:transcription-repair coupling factor (superfamily II helicase)